MELELVTKTVEFSVATADDPLVFKIEIRKKSGRRAAFMGRLYRLELLRFKARGKVRRGVLGWTNVDYRCWVVDDNFSFEAERFPSERSVINAILRRLGSQLGIARPEAGR